MRGRAVRRMAARLAASKEQLQARLGLRSSNAAQPHRNRAKEAKHPSKGNRSNWIKDLRRDDG